MPSRSSSPSQPLDRPEPFQFELRTIFVVMAIVGVCTSIFTLLGWLALPIDGILLGFVLWTAGNLRGSHRMRRGGMTLAAAGVFGLLGIFLFFGWLLWCVAAGVVAGLIHARRRRLNQRSLLWTLATAAKAQAPLVPALEAFSRECSGGYGRRVRRLAALLAGGNSLERGLADLRLLPCEHRIALRLGVETGQLPAALRETADAQAAIEPMRQTAEWHGLYLWWVLATMGGISLFIAIKLLSAFQRIFRDFELEQGLAAVVRRLDTSTVEELATWFVAAVALLGVAFTVKTFLGWSLFVSRRDTALVLRALAYCTAKKAPVEVGLRALADLHPRHASRRRARRLLKRLAAGSYWLDGLRRFRLIGKSEAGVLRASAGADHLPWTLRELAASAERRHIYRRQMLLETMLPLAVVFLGVLVFAVVAVCFVPLVELISELSART